MVKKCIVCNIEFDARHGRINTCSDECKVKKIRMIEGNYRKRQNKTYKKNCLFCGIEFTTSKSYKVTCSDKCSENRRVKKIYEEQNDGTVKIEAICPGCGKKHLKNVQEYAASVNYTPRYYCSRFPECMKDVEHYECFSQYQRAWGCENRSLA